MPLISEDGKENARLTPESGGCRTQSARPPEFCGRASDRELEESWVPESDSWIERRVETPVGPVPVVRTRLSRQDVIGKVRVRFGFGRMSYQVKPGLYAVGDARPDSPVLVSANYKLSFDALRQELDGIAAWILVLDTKGINVWCAAGKGTFGTEELVRQINDTALARVVSHRTLILPQLGAPGVAAHEVTKRTHFKVVYGPVRAADIKAFLASGTRATPEMRLVRFNLKDRFVLTAIELTSPFKYLVIITAILWIMDLLGLHLLSWKAWYPYLGAILIGGFLVPVLLPWIPGRAFALKGWFVGMIWAAFVNVNQGSLPPSSSSWIGAVTQFLLLPAISAFLAMGFTGSSTYTSLSGVLKEMRYAVPAILASASIGIVFLAVGLITGL